MTNYRVAVDGATDPLAISTELAAQQAARRMLGIHALVTLLSVGLWIPVLLWSLLTRHGRAAAAVDGYAVRIVDGQLFVGTRAQHSLIPLERIRALSTSQGVVLVSGDQQTPTPLLGMLDPLAASQAILAARDEKLMALRAGGGAGAVEELASVDHLPRKSGAR